MTTFERQVQVAADRIAAALPPGTGSRSASRNARALAVFERAAKALEPKSEKKKT